MSQAVKKILKLGARGSLLSRMQSESVARMLERLSPDGGGVKVEMVTVMTTGDRVQDRPLHELGGKGLFTKELELALINGEVDFAVHSFKDVPVTLPLVDTTDLVIAATPLREDARDALVSLHARSVAELRPGARVGTGSLRRQAQMLALRSDVKVEPIRGNVDTRLKKLRAGEFDAIILAMAGLKRSALFDSSLMTPLGEFLPAAGQGALAIQCRRDNSEVRALLEKLNDPPTALAVQMERAIVQGLKGDCHSPIAAHAAITGNQVHLRAAVATRGGFPPIVRADMSGSTEDAAAIVESVLNRLKELGAMELLGT